MQKIKSKTMAISIAIFLMLSMSASMMLIPNASAHTPAWQIQLYAFINVAPNPAGIGQTVTLGFWLNAPPMTSGTIYGDKFGPFTVHVVKPDGTNETLGPFISDDTGGTSTRYTPAELGTYSFQMTFPGMTLTGSANNPLGTGTMGISNPNYVNDTILPATSNVATLTVQQQPVGGVSVAPLPTTYWQTPINAMNVNNWYAIGGPYLGLYMGYSAGKGASNYNTTTNFNPYTTAPLTSHIMWTRPVAFGGAIGGDAGGTTTYGNYYSTSQYERKYLPTVINGYIYYTEFPGSSSNPLANVCVNLYNGQTVWTDDASNYGGGSPSYNMLTTTGVVTPLACGQVLDYVSPNQYGGIAYLWTSGTPAWITPSVMNLTFMSTTLNMFDAMTGKYILSIVNGTGFSYGNTVDASGDLVFYYTNTTVGTQTIGSTNILPTGPALQKVTTAPGGSLLECWNSTQCIMAGVGWMTNSNQGWFWRPVQGTLVPFSAGIQSAWQLPTSVPVGAYANNATMPNVFTMVGVNSGVAILYSAANNGLTNYFQTGYMIYTGYDMNTGNQLWVQNITFTPYTAVNLDNYGNVGDGVFITVIKETGQVTAFSVTTGKQVWATTLTGANGAAINPYDTIGGIKGNIYGNSFLLFGFGGDLWSLSMSTGAVNWYTNTTAITGAAGTNTPYGVWPIWVQTGFGGGGGIEFLEEGHEYAPPLFLGAQLLALNTTNGQLVWSTDSFDVDANPELAYGIMTTLNAYDNQIYAYGMGPSKTTVTAPSVGVTTATPVTITGTVTDISAGSQQQAVAANFPNGLPCVSDASMSQWMEYVYMQQPEPNNVTSVPVTLTAIDPNGNFVTLGTTTSDASGTYSLTWTPPAVSGNYAITATFAGTEGYYGSSAEAHVYVGPAPATPAPTATPVAGLATMSGLTIGIAAVIIVMIIAIAIVGLLLIRKKP
jgi:hypothetical protein